MKNAGIRYGGAKDDKLARSFPGERDADAAGGISLTSEPAVRNRQVL
jgi:hypothetical protein